MLSVVEYERMLERDGYHCYHCGTTEGLVPNHRRNRGMGGSKAREVPSNVVTLCSSVNGLIESDDRWAELARRYGWKLREGEDPLGVPAYDRQARTWYMFDDTWSRMKVLFS